MPRDMLRKLALISVWPLCWLLGASLLVQAAQANQPESVQSGLIQPEPVQVKAGEVGLQQTGQAQVLHDPDSRMSIADAFAAQKAGQFTALESAGSTGLEPGAYWAWFQLHNTEDEVLPLRLEYVDHQLIYLDAFVRRGTTSRFDQVVELSMERPFSHRPVQHNRFVIPLELPANAVTEVLVRFGSKESGYVYPSMRIWSPQNLYTRFLQESNLMSFLFGGFFLMGMFALVVGAVTGRKYFFLYALYACAKIFAWATILGYTHQFWLRDYFHWSLMSITGAVAILLGLVFAREFLQTRSYVPRLDKALLLMVVNALVLLIAALLQLKQLALLAMTLALLMYPFAFVAALLRWRQGMSEAGIFSLAWGVLVFGLMFQALRDLGLVAHTSTNYFWPPVASFTEMLTIMCAMGLQMRRLLRDKEQAENRHREHLENAKISLEEEVKVRTRELEQAKWEAEQEARTDPLTGILNRRSFMHDASLRLKLAERQQQGCCLLMIDLDHFKHINDTFGHQVGDEVLCSFTDRVTHAIRETDVFGRIGGEEFALLVGESREAATALAERLIKDIAAMEIASAGQPVSVTASIGLAASAGDTDIETLFQLSDMALYQAKGAGRNRVIEATVRSS